MFVRRLAAVGLLAAAAVPALPTPATAHGAPMTPISRSAACGGNGIRRGAAACKAALKATGGFLGAYDNVRLADVENDRTRVPDGKLCSAGIDLYRGLDLPRDDFPSTTVRSGQELRISYRGTIPHRGSFRLYLTRAGYDPSGRLTWDDLGSPLDEVKDPPLTDGAYRMSVTLPRRTGRHILYVVWETTSTPDTYYSCSDLVFPAPQATTAPPAAPSVAAPGPSVPAPGPSVAAPATRKAAVVKTTAAVPPPEPGPAGTTADPEPVAAATPEPEMVGFGHWLIGGAFTVALLAAAGAGLSRIRHRRID